MQGLILFLFPFLFLLGSQAFGQLFYKNGDRGEMFLNASALHPISINGSDTVSTNVNINWIYGRVGSVSGIQIGYLGNHVIGDIKDSLV